MMDYHFVYLNFFCEAEELETKLNDAGELGWRLHTCEPVVLVGPQGSGSLSYAVIMDMGPLLNEEQQEADDEEIKDFAAMSME